MNITANEFTLAAAVASPAGTVVFAYPAGYVQADFTSANASASAYLLLNDNDRFEEADDEFDISYGASTVTLTNKTGYSWPVGTRVLVGMGRANPTETFQQAGAVANLTGALTGATDGAMADIAALSTSDTYTDAAVNAAITAINLQFKELQAKLNEALTALRAAGIIAT
jgi:hypothetical protein